MENGSTKVDRKYKSDLTNRKKKLISIMPKNRVRNVMENGSTEVDRKYKSDLTNRKEQLISIMPEPSSEWNGERLYEGG